MELELISFENDLRKVWNNEERDFTPWLANNLNTLGSTLGVDLEIINIEHDVGAFSLDILAKDINTGDIVAIENQLEITDHCHLGQIFTYASGVDAKIIVWISKEVREEHRKAIDWFNQITGEEMSFFAIQVQLIKVDDSKPAPFFKIVASPNDWSKVQKTKVSAKTEFTISEARNKEFFTKLLELINKSMSGFTNSRKVGYDAWKSFPCGVSGANYTIAFRSCNRISCELYIDGGDKEKNKERFDAIIRYKEDIESKLGVLSWEKLDDKRACRIAVRDASDNETMLS